MNRRIPRTLGILIPLALVLPVFAGGSAGAAVRCAKYKPGADGIGKPITKVTNKNTKAKPATIEVATDPGFGFSSPDGASGDTGQTSHQYTNVQVDSTKRSAKLFVLVEFLPGEDYDIFLRTNTGAATAYAAGFNEAPAPDGGAVGTDGTGHGGHSEVGAEAIDGFAVKDCSGFTLDIVSASTMGGSVTVKYWLNK